MSRTGIAAYEHPTQIQWERGLVLVGALRKYLDQVIEHVKSVRFSTKKLALRDAMARLLGMSKPPKPTLLLVQKKVSTVGELVWQTDETIAMYL